MVTTVRQAIERLSALDNQDECIVCAVATASEIRERVAEHMGDDAKHQNLLMMIPDNELVEMFGDWYYEYEGEAYTDSCDRLADEIVDEAKKK